MKVELNNKGHGRKCPNTWSLNNTLLQDQWAMEEIREEIKKFLGFNENENVTYQNLWDTAKENGKVYCHECMHYNHRKIWNKLPTAVC
jgi:endonuclease III-like uncharacterized protein